LLRVLQEKEVERIGGKATIKVDFRVIAATNRNLNKEVLEGRFRSDLYYRLHIFPIQLPPLRERKEDIPLLATYFAQMFSKKIGKPYVGISQTMLTEMLSYNWPGNIRELESIIEQAIILCDKGMLDWSRPQPLKSYSAVPVVPEVSFQSGISHRTIKSQREQWEEERIMQALAQAEGRIRGLGGAAELLGIKPTTLEAKMKKLGIQKRHMVL
jgi:transcriptional regulator with GAF, ATPase, and Fis domain